MKITGILKDQNNWKQQVNEIQIRISSVLTGGLLVCLSAHGNSETRSYLCFFFQQVGSPSVDLTKLHNAAKSGQKSMTHRYLALWVAEGEHTPCAATCAWVYVH